MEDPIEKKAIGVRMKEYETLSLEVTKIPPHRPFIVRLDGRSFSNFTAGMRRPFDFIFTKAMIKTTSDLLNEFQAVTGYTHSDEITIIFKQMCTKEEMLKTDIKFTHIFDGRVIKLLTVISGYCSVRFNYHLVKLINLNQQHYKEDYVEKINEMQASFDARLVIFPEGKEEEIVNHMIWRSVFDCERNAVSTYARNFFSQKEVHEKSKLDMIKMLKGMGIDWDKTEGEGSVPMIFKHGCYVKRKLFEIEVDEKYEKYNNGKKAMRNMFVVKTFKIKFDKFFCNLMLNKYWALKEKEMNELEIEKVKDIKTIDIEKYNC